MPRWQPPLAARQYEEELRAFFGDVPRFDLILLGMGADGHTASLFPRTAVLHEKDRWVVENYVEEAPSPRITLAVPVINAAVQVTFIVSGGDKADRLRRVLQGPYLPEEQPAQLIKPTSGGLLWLTDAAAPLLRNTETTDDADA